MEVDNESEGANGTVDHAKDRSLNRHIWIINQLFSMSKNSVIFSSDNLVKEILSYLLVNSYFETANEKQDLNKHLISNEHSEKLESHIRDTLLRYIGILLNKNECASNKAVIELIKYVRELIEKKNNKENLKLVDNLVEKVSEYKSLSDSTIKILSNLNEQLEVIILKALFLFIRN